MQKLAAYYLKTLKILVYALAYVSGFSVFAMIVITCADVIFRRFGMPLHGAYDLIRIFGALTLACALPYTTAVKGHVAIEYFFHKLGKRNRIIVDSGMRVLSIIFFAFLGYRCIIYGNSLYKSGEVSLTLQLSLFWVPYVIAISSFVVLLVIFDNLIHPNKEMIKP